MAPRVGVLLLENTHLAVPGALGLPDTFEPPSLLEVVPGAISSLVLSDEAQELLSAYSEAARTLAARGADIITTNCGYCARYQHAVSTNIDVPVALSGLLLVDTLVRIYGRLGVLTYDRDALRPIARNAGWPDVPLADVCDLQPWRALGESGPVDLDLAAMEDELMSRAQEFVARHQLSALLLECTGMLPFKTALERRVGRPCFDLIDLLNLLGAHSRRRAADA